MSLPLVYGAEKGRRHKRRRTTPSSFGPFSQNPVLRGWVNDTPEPVQSKETPSYGSRHFTPLTLPTKKSKKDPDFETLRRPSKKQTNEIGDVR